MNLGRRLHRIAPGTTSPNIADVRQECWVLRIRGWTRGRHVSSARSHGNPRQRVPSRDQTGIAASLRRRE